MAEDYTKARRIADKEYHRALQKGQYPYLPALDDILPYVETLQETPVGVFEIPLSMVVGTKTVGRQNAFASNFMPLLKDGSEFSLKWQHLYDAQLTEGIRDPVKVYEFMKRFYVLEGNKRVSVMKYLGVRYISAEVIRILPKKTEEKDNKLYYEFLEFYKAVPIYNITFTELGYYRKLAEQVGRDLSEPWPDDDVMNLKAAYNIFCDCYREKGGENLSITAGDAFLIYLSIYRLDGLLWEKKSRISDRIGRIWNEFLTETNDNHIALQEKPAEAAPPKLHDTLLGVLKRSPEYTEAHPLRVAFMYDRDPEGSRWIYGHELGRTGLETKFEGLVETLRYDNCSTEEKMREAVDAAVEDDCGVIFTISPTMMEETLRAAIHFPKIRFLNCSVNLSHNAVRTYYPRMYEAKFLLGALAASVSQNHKIGYRADYPIYGNIANINAFAIGAAMIDPGARIFLSWSTQKDSENEDWQKKMTEQGIRVISGPDLIRPVDASRAYGLYLMEEDGEVINLAAPVWNWGRYYELIVRSVLDGTWNARSMVKKDQATNYWYGMTSGVVDVILSDRLSYYSRKMVSILKNALMAETLNPFDGELRSKKGEIKEANAPRLSNEEIIRMNWLNDNVIGEIPNWDKLTEKAKETVSVSGVEEDK